MFAVTSVVVCPGRRAVFVRGTVYDGGEARLFQDRRAEELMISSPDPRAHKPIGRGVGNFDNTSWDHVREDAVLAGTSANFSQNMSMKQQLLSTGTKRLSASSFDPVWGIGARADDPEASNSRRWPGKKMLETLFLPPATSFAQARPGWHIPPSLIIFSLRPRSTEL